MMKRFLVFVFAVSACFVGLGSLAEYVGAQLKSDEKALDIVRRARAAIGGEAAIAEIRGMVITGSTTHHFKVDGVDRSEPGETEIAMQFPDKLMKKISVGSNDGTAARSAAEMHDVHILTKDGFANVEEHPSGSGEFTTSDGKTFIVKRRAAVEGEVIAGGGEHKVLVRKMDDAAKGEVRIIEGDTVRERRAVELARVSTAPRARTGAKQNELLRMTLSLLLTAPEGINVNYTFAGETVIDGVPVNIVNAEFGGANYKLYIGRSSSLPVAMSYQGFALPTMIKFTKADAGTAPDAPHDTMVLARKFDNEPMTEYLVKFSDYRVTGNVQLPYKWTTTVAGSTKDVLDVTSYEINPANIAERFQNHKTYFRVKKADGQ